MKKVSMSKWRQCILSGVLLIALTLTSIMVCPATTKAAEEVEEKFPTQVVYEKDTTDYFSTWKAQETKIAPVKEGYLFGGWYTDDQGKGALKTWTVKDHTGPVYAKFVPAHVLSVKVQWASNVTNDGELKSLRILTGVDSLRYQSVGVEVSLGNRSAVKDYPKTQVYDTICVGSDKTVKADQTFRAPAQYYGVWLVGSIGSNNFNKPIYVRPYWVTQDGTTVYGMAKYFHTSDTWNNYITVPINKMPAQSDTGSAEAAGMVTVKYDPNEVEFIGVNGVEPGRIFGVGKAAFDVDYSEVRENGVVTIVENATTAGSSKKDETLFANLIFKRTDPIFSLSGNEYVRSKYLNFTISDAKFCDWKENLTEKTESDSLGVWDITY